ncbi:MAG: EamA family transporter [Paracoccaceae bacterium]
MTFATLGFGLMLVLPVAMLAAWRAGQSRVQGLAILALLGLVPAAGANLLRILTIRSAEAGVHESLTNYLVPMFAVLFGAVFLASRCRAV